MFGHQGRKHLTYLRFKVCGPFWNVSLSHTHSLTHPMRRKHDKAKCFPTVNKCWPEILPSFFFPLLILWGSETLFTALHFHHNLLNWSNKVGASRISAKPNNLSYQLRAHFCLLPWYRQNILVIQLLFLNKCMWELLCGFLQDMHVAYCCCSQIIKSV